MFTQLYNFFSFVMNIYKNLFKVNIHEEYYELWDDVLF